MSFDLKNLVIREGRDWIAFNKPPGVAIQSREKESFLDKANSYCQQSLFVVHRIDQPVSGLVLFAKTRKGVFSLNDQLSRGEIQRTYLAIVENEPNPLSGKLVHYLRKNEKTNKSFVFPEHTRSTKKAELKYRVLGRSDYYFLVEIELTTGRHHQIRTQLSAINCFIKGDVKYGAKRANPDRSIHLHAWKLSFEDPNSQSRIQLEAPLPKEVLWNYFSSIIYTDK